MNTLDVVVGRSEQIPKGVEVETTLRPRKGRPAGSRSRARRRRRGEEDENGGKKNKKNKNEDEGGSPEPNAATLYTTNTPGVLTSTVKR